MASHGPPLLESTTTGTQSHDTARPLHKKRKTRHTAVDWANQTINIQAHAASLSDDPFVLEPIAVVPRSRLPLSWIEPCSTLSQIQHGSLFVADIPVLEAESSKREPSVLAVRLIGDGGLYVVERVKAGIYALSKLVRGIEDGDIFVVLKGWSPLETSLRSVPATAGGDWWEIARIDDPGMESEVSAKRTRFEVSVVFGVSSVVEDVCMKGVSPMDSSESRAQSLAPRLPLERSVSSDARVSTSARMQQLNGVLVSEGVGDGLSLQSPQELLDNLREQYLQALYISKTSLAYFAKGPLTRYRVAFKSSNSEPAKTNDLIDFYRETILTAKKMDLKYRETLPAAIQDAIICVSDEEPCKAKKSKNRKKKLGRNGLYPEEDRFVRRWWKDRSLADLGTSEETFREVEMKKHIADLRLRETQLQILLILETLALEAAGEAKPDKDNSELSHKTQKKTKKLQELKVMLELHLDRLCIWHAVSFEDTSVEAAKASEMSGKKVESDALRDFCTELIIPFYASRLPDKCKSITRKLGVSSAASFSSKQSQAKKVPPPGEPGAADERQAVQKRPRRAFQRVLTDEQSTSQNRPPSLSRSSTTLSHPEARRDSIDPLLPTLSASVRGGIQKAKRAENREVDLIAVSRQHETKLKKVQMLTDQKKELDAAINALRKPNRELVAKDIAEDADKRRGSARKSKNPVRNPLGQGVQVAATPRGGRRKDTVIGLPPLPRRFTQSSAQRKGQALFSDESPKMSSSIRPNSFSGTPSTKDTGVIQETPSRRPAQGIGSYDDAVASVSESPSLSKNQFRVPPQPNPRSTEMLAPSTPVSSRHVDAFHRPDFPVGSKSSIVTETPPPKPSGTVKTTPSTKILSTPVKGSSAQRGTIPVTPEKSIYEQLGWDDDDLVL
ncbi:hypothetical protein EYZ11_009583 [Aspergillus tanneri]|uniref:DNA replication regulator Sld3 C-terminal domain-containing protein n=1 Tax=Aspergillus tanneri TaxID=1220188 RepID=A0A4V3UNF3_9EURO|nr:uncharacterized protein ATNIH1004_000961 [Aspergillus tanneri]KAA8652060.1 hypothetical protein ATNIH1004_000961 [Aspergillus tanneri]THC90954.1 hypothetical protein EYZ11_009583 [Aspergillus tanneri]